MKKFIMIGVTNDGYTYVFSALYYFSKPTQDDIENFARLRNINPKSVTIFESMENYDD